MSSYSPIGIFDSGVGGLSLLQQVRGSLPRESLCYLADSAHAPYGGKTRGFVLDRSRCITDFLITRGAKAILVACNTATAMAVDRLREEYDLPILAMEPAIKPAARLTRSQVIGVLATAGTLGSERYASLRDRHGRDVQVLEKICHHWVEQVESGDVASEAARQLVTGELQSLLGAGADVLVLGCTHFPFLRPLIAEVASEAVQILDPAPAVAEHLAKQLEAGGLLAEADAKPALEFWTSGEPAQQSALFQRLLGERVEIRGVAI